VRKRGISACASGEVVSAEWHEATYALAALQYEVCCCCEPKALGSLGQLL